MFWRHTCTCSFKKQLPPLQLELLFLIVIINSEESLLQVENYESVIHSVMLAWRWWRIWASIEKVRQCTYKSSSGRPGDATSHDQYNPQPLRLFAMMTSVTASKTNCTFSVSVAHVWWQYISLFSDLFLLSNWACMYAAADRKSVG